MAMLDESKEAVMATPAVTGINPAAGLPSNDPDAQARMREAMKMRGMDYARAGIMGAAAGGQAGAQTMNPLAAFVQGMAAGLQAPAQIYAQKREQVNSVIEATPFGEIVPEAKDPKSPYHFLSGIPYGIAVKGIEGIAKDAARMAQEKEQRQAEAEREYIQEGEDAQNMARLLQEADPEHKPRSPKSLVGFRRQDLSDLIKITSGKQPQQTIGSAAADRAFAREYAEYMAGGGYSDTQNQIKSLEDAREQLKSGGQYTGFFTNLFSGSVVNPKALALQQQIESSVQRTLKQTLGGQFTEREGVMFMRRGFDPKLSEAQNIKKLTRMIDQLKIMDIAKRESMEYFEQNGTLEGYRGKFYTINDGKIEINDPSGVKSGLTKEEEKELERLEKEAMKKGAK